MENASKALMMAGGVLIGVLIISVMVMVLRQGGQLSSSYDSQLSEQQLLKFNSQFEVFNDNENTFFDVITTVNLAYDVNTSVNWEAGNGVSVKITSDEAGTNVKHSILDNQPIGAHQMAIGTGSTQKDIYSELVKEYGATKLISGEEKYKYNFPCIRIGYNANTGKVNEVIFRVQENS